MLVPTRTGFLEIVKEPQFEDIYTVRTTDLESAMLIRKHTRSRIIFNDYSKDFCFFGYAYLEDIAQALNMKIKPELVEKLKKNISPAPVGYRVYGFWYDKEDDIQADVLADELASFRYDTDFHFDEFRAWPLFNLTDELVEQMNRAA